MATIPCTIIVCSIDKLLLPLNAVCVIMKQLFQYGVKDIFVKGNKVFIFLAYSPKTSTLKRKFGNLEIKHMRTRIETEEELQIPEKTLKICRFNLHEDDESETIEAGTSTGVPSKKLTVEDTITQNDDEAEDYIIQPSPNGK